MAGRIDATLVKPSAAVATDSTIEMIQTSASARNVQPRMLITFATDLRLLANGLHDQPQGKETHATV